MVRMTAPRTGVKVRMYRQGHGDCFLLAFAGYEGRRKRNVYVLIDCGLKPKSEIHRQPIEDVIDDIHQATGGRVDVVIVTHEHQDHVNGFAKKKRGTHLFDKISFGQVWLAWTEDGTDDLANRLRDRFRDTLVALAFAQERVAALAGADDLRDRLSDLIGLEVGDEGAAPPAGDEAQAIRAEFDRLRQANPLMAAAELAAASIEGITNKRAIKYLRDRAEGPPKFLRPDRDPAGLPHVKDLKVFALGPPRDEQLLLDLDPRPDEEFHLAGPGRALTLDGASRSFLAAMDAAPAGGAERSPFARRYLINGAAVMARDRREADHADDRAAVDAARERRIDYLRRSYGGADPNVHAPDPDAAVAWRRIDDDWLNTAEGLALRLNDEVNNTSLVLAFELPRTGKVLLFTGDAQRGSWIGWSNLEWTDEDDKSTTARDLLSRCVLYKVGHHGSHNATLNGTENDSDANLGWMARGDFSGEFVAMIPANTAWALGKSRPWLHPLPKIEEALKDKARGRVFRSDLDHVSRPDASVIGDDDWRAFQNRIKETRLYFEYTIEDK